MDSPSPDPVDAPAPDLAALDAPPAKASPRRDNRAAAMQFLYMWDINPGNDLIESLRQFFETLDHPRDYYKFAEELIRGTHEHQVEIDGLITQHATNWAFNRIARVDLAILRLAIFELKHRRDIPPIVTINEAIELGKIYSNPDSRRFLNGLLDKVRESLDRPSRTAAEN